MKKIAVFILLVSLASIATAKEEISLTNPITTPSITTWKVTSLLLRTTPDPVIEVILVGSNGKIRQFSYTEENDDPLTKIKALNKANLSTKSLEKRILEQLQADYPELAGTVTGTPD